MTGTLRGGWWTEYLAQDVAAEDFSPEQNALFETYKLTQDQKRIFQSIKTGKNLFLSDDLTDEEIIWNIGVVNVNPNHRGDMVYYRKRVLERLKRFDEAEQRYLWKTGKWTEEAMRALIEQWTQGMMVVIPDVESSDGSPMIFTKEWYEHLPAREELPEGYWEFRATRVYPLMARSICLSYPMATMKGLVSFADMTDFDWDKYDMDQKTRHSDVQAVIPNKLRRMISVNPDERMKKQLEDFKDVAKKYGFVMYGNFHEAIRGEEKLLPSELPSWVGGTAQVDIKSCLRHLFRRENDALDLMERVFDEMNQDGKIRHPQFMQAPSEKSLSS